MNPDLLKLNRLPRKQKGQRIETRTAFFLRYYVSTPDGRRTQECVKLADKSDLYRSWTDVEPVIARELERVNAAADVLTGRLSLTDYIEKHDLPCCEPPNKSAATARGYRQGGERYLRPQLGGVRW
jgi:hypothetical protein